MTKPTSVDEDKAPAEICGPVEEGRGDADQFLGMSAVMDKFARSFEASARRWELVVYPLLFAFVLLAAYGFYLIYQLTASVGQITGRMDVIAEQMVVIADDMHLVSGDFSTVTKDVHHISGNIDKLSLDIEKDTAAIIAMSGSIERMTRSMAMMSVSVYEMRYDTRSMGRNIQNSTGPMRFMNAFVPR